MSSAGKKDGGTKQRSKSLSRMPQPTLQTTTRDKGGGVKPRKVRSSSTSKPRSVPGKPDDDSQSKRKPNGSVSSGSTPSKNTLPKGAPPKVASDIQKPERKTRTAASADPANAQPKMVNSGKGSSTSSLSTKSQTRSKSSSSRYGIDSAIAKHKERLTKMSEARLQRERQRAEEEQEQAEYVASLRADLYEGEGFRFDDENTRETNEEHERRQRLERIRQSRKTDFRKTTASDRS